MSTAPCFGSPADSGHTIRACPKVPGMSQAPEELAQEPPKGHVRVVYLGPVAPHWDIQSDFGDRAVIEDFRQRALARLVLLPPHDPQFRRNRENLLLEWDLGIPEEEDEV
jgi:hypothetical protein